MEKTFPSLFDKNLLFSYSTEFCPKRQEKSLIEVKIMAIHDGHRDRMKLRFLQEGLDNFSDVQVLEILLFYCIPRQDTNPIAHRLLKRFGTLAQVLEAPVKDLQNVDGVGPNAALFLNLISETSRYYQVNRAMQNQVLNTLDKCGDFLIPHFVGRRNETVFLLCLDAKCKLLCCTEISEGSVNAAGISARKVVEAALAANATTVILAHNHPSGVAVPSGEDIMTTKHIAAALEMVDVILADHIIVSDDDYTSMVASGLFRPKPDGARV